MRLTTLVLPAVALFMGCKKDIQQTNALPAAEPIQVVMIMHAVAAFEPWRAGYAANDTLRQSHGLSSFAVGRGTTDTNMVITFNILADVEKARAFIGSAELHNVMLKAGMTDTPRVVFGNVIRRDTQTIAIRERVMITHHVKAFNTWLKAYDEEGPEVRASHGLLERAIMRSIDDPSLIYVFMAITDLDKARARIASEELKSLMARAGVIGTPEIFFYKLDES